MEAGSTFNGVKAHTHLFNHCYKGQQLLTLHDYFL